MARDLDESSSTIGLFYKQTAAVCSHPAVRLSMAVNARLGAASGGMILLQTEFDRGHKTHDLLFADFGRARQQLLGERLAQAASIRAVARPAAVPEIDA